MNTPRYGVTTRKKVESIRMKSSQRYKCPRCKTFSMKRISSGLWKCKKCGLVVASDAYSMSVEKI